MISINEEKLKNFNFAGKAEWLETNGLGGYSSSTLAGSHSRRYHGLLVAATQIPTGRTVLISKLDETLILGNKRIELGANNFNGVINPQGYQYLKSFKKDLYPEWTFQCDNILIRKSLLQPYKKNTTLLKYEVLESTVPFQMILQPFLNPRDYHELKHCNDQLHWDVDFKNGLFHNKPFNNDLDIFIYLPGSEYHHHPIWYKNYKYEEEVERGQDFNEDLLCYGEIEITLKKGDIIFMVLSMEDPNEMDASQVFEEEVFRRSSLFTSKGGEINPGKKGNRKNSIKDILTLAADQFIVQRNIYLNNDEKPLEGATVIAGYHWFTDWGRDTMISLPGLCITTGRFDEAKKILTAFAHSVDKGMLPNFFSDKNGIAEFNNVDGTLWFFIASYHLFKATGDREFVLGILLPVLEEIIEWHLKGTRYNIHMDPEDNLLYAGEWGQQLTWMDARIGNWVVTPRMGKPVEIQALWYNAICIMEEFSKEAGNKVKKEEYAKRGLSIRENFTKKFWFEKGNYLYDSINENNITIETFRPNQILAISLPFELILGEKAKSILQKTKDILYTPVGLRSLGSNEPNYHGYYGGDQWQRDSGYHQGAVWSWLLGPYIDALVKVNTPKASLKKIIKDFSYHLEEAGIGTISEIFDGDAPHPPKGCIAQAWSVAELLRVITTYELD